MAVKRIEAVKLKRLEARIRVIQGMGRLVLIAFGGALGFVVVATAVPQKRELDALERKLEQAREHERMVMSERNHRQVELRALREDPGFLEIQARDRLDYAGEGERVLRVRRDR
jgi:Septum formation initiator